jgi:uncharacterized protein involved in exopolysaccharide biosynthesis
MSFTIDENAFSFADVTAILRRRYWLILGIFVFVLGAAVVYTLVAPKQYSTRMKVLVKNERADMIVSPNQSGAMIYPSEVSETRINSEIELLTSNDLLRRVVSKSGLDRLQTGYEQPLAVEKAVQRLQHNLKTTPVKKANVILVEYIDTDPRRAAAVLSDLSELYLEEHLKIHGTPGTYEFFKSQADIYKSQLASAESSLNDLRRRENIDMLSQQKEVAFQKAAESESALMQAGASIGDHQRRIENMRGQFEATQPRIITQSRTSSNQYTVERLNTMLAELQNHRTELLAKFRPDDRLIQQVDQEIADTRGALDRAAHLNGLDETTDVNPVRQAIETDLAKEQSELAGLQSRRDELKGQTATYRAKLGTLAGITSTFDDLMRTQKEAEENYLLYSKKTEEARIAESLDKQKIANVAIAEGPVEPRQPSKPNVPINIGLGFFMACLLSFGLAFVVEHFRTSVEQPQELEDLTGLPVLATSYGD